MKSIRIILLLITIIAIAIAGYFYWKYTEVHPSTNDAYIGANIVKVAAQVNGQISELLVSANQQVEEGQLLLKIDARPYEIALQRAEANLKLAQQAKITAQSSIDTATAQIAEHQAEYEDALHNNNRIQRLLKNNSIARSSADTAKYRLREANAARTAANAELQQAKHQVEEATTQISIATSAINEAKLQLAYTQITAPVTGILGPVNIRPGDVITAGQQLFPLMQQRPVWVDANFKETDLHRIKPGQSAKITVDMYPDTIFHGRVETLSPASGAAFSLLPPENATGNWVKVTQRFSVRVIIDDASSSTPLRVGASCTVSIDTSKTIEDRAGD
jgi:membrane fusion protein (multidrug efflux system)